MRRIRTKSLSSSKNGGIGWTTLLLADGSEAILLAVKNIETLDKWREIFDEASSKLSFPTMNCGYLEGIMPAGLVKVEK